MKLFLQYLADLVSQGDLDPERRLFVDARWYNIERKRKGWRKISREISVYPDILESIVVQFQCNGFYCEQGLVMNPRQGPQVMTLGP